MITRIVKVKLKPESLSEFSSYIPHFVKEVRNFKNNHHADCFADLEENADYHIYTIWNTEGALNKFLKSELNLEFKQKLNNWAIRPYSAWTVENIK
ncbi:MAG: putative quinol monooxygenase [Salinivirgaceae bacterium]